MKLKIKGKFVVETESAIMNNVKQPLEYLELEVIPTIPLIVNSLKSYNKKKVEDGEKKQS